MKITKLLALFLVLLSLFALLSAGSFASSSAPRLVDGADLLTKAEEQALLTEMDEMSERLDFDFLIFTVDDTGGQDILDYADTYHARYGYRADAVMLILDMSDREWCVATYGFGNKAVSQDATYYYLEDCFLSPLSSDNYRRAFEGYLEGAEKLVSDARDGHFYVYIPWERNIFIALFLGVIIALVTVFSMRSKLKSVSPKKTAGGYVKQGSFKLRRERDLFLFRTHTRTYSPRQSSSGGRGGGGSRGGGRGHF